MAITRDKARLRERLTVASLRQPRVIAVDPDSSPDEALRGGTSYVVKATSLSGLIATVSQPHGHHVPLGCCPGGLW